MLHWDATTDAERSTYELFGPKCISSSPVAALKRWNGHETVEHGVADTDILNRDLHMCNLRAAKACKRQST